MDGFPDPGENLQGVPEHQPTVPEDLHFLWCSRKMDNSCHTTKQNIIQEQSFYSAKPRRQTVRITTYEIRDESLEEVPTNTTLP